MAALLVVLGVGGIKEGFNDPDEGKFYAIAGFGFLLIGGPLLIYLKSLRTSANTGYMTNPNLPALEAGAYLFIVAVALSIIAPPIIFSIAKVTGEYGQYVQNASWSDLLNSNDIIKTAVLIILARSAWILIKTRKSLPAE